MPDAKAIIRISAAPDSSLRKALAGTVDAMQKAAKQSAATEIKAAKEAEREKLRASKAAEKAANAAGKSAIAAAKAAEKAQLKASHEVEQANRREAQVAQRLARMQAREAEKLAKEEVKWSEWAEKLKYQAVQRTSRMAERAAAQQRREAAKATKAQVQEATKASRSRRETALMVGGAVAGAGAQAFGRVRSFASTFGARSNEEMLAKAVETHRRLVILGDMGGISEEQRGALKSKILATSARTGLDSDDLIAGLEKAQDGFSDLKGFTQILDQVADIATATKTPVEDVVGAMGVMRRQFGLTDEEMQKLGGAMVSAADLGSVSFADLAEHFGTALGAMGRNANLHGLSGAMTALTVSQALGESDVGAAEASTLGVRVVSALNDVKVQSAVKRAYGVDITEGGKLGGAMRDLPTILQELADKGFMDPEKGALRQAVFTEERSQRGIEVLAKLWQDKPEKVKQLLAVNPNEGLDTVKRRIAQLGAGVEGQAATLGARQFETFMKGDSMQKYMEAAVKSADTLAKIEAGHPIMAEVVGIGSSALKGLASALLANRILGGAAAAGQAAVAAGGATAGTAATGVAAAGLGTMALGATAAGAAGYFGTSALMEATGQDKEMFDFGAKIWDATHYRARQKTRGTEPGEKRQSSPNLEPQQSRVELPEIAAALARLDPASQVPAQTMTPVDATLTVKVDGPARVTRVDSDGWGTIETIADNGLRTIFPR